MDSNMLVLLDSEVVVHLLSRSIWSGERLCAHENVLLKICRAESCLLVNVSDGHASLSRSLAAANSGCYLLGAFTDGEYHVGA